jgi:hypothetical protein
MAKFPSTFAVDTGNKLSERFFDIRWMSLGFNSLPPKRWFGAGESLPEGELSLWGRGSVDAEGRLVAKYYGEELFGSIDEMPKMWFLLLDGRDQLPAHFLMLGFVDDRFPAGTVVDGKDAHLERSYMGTWAGLINWRAGDPMLQQITTAERWRRNRIAVIMFGVCDVVNACYGFSLGKVLHGGAVTTEAGEKLRSIYSGGADRIDPRIGSVTPAEDVS